MSRLRNRMIQDLKLAGLVEGTQDQYLRWPCSPTDRLLHDFCHPISSSERHVEKYILYVRDELGVARGTFVPMFFGLKFFYVNTLGYDLALCSPKKSPQAEPAAVA